MIESGEGVVKETDDRDLIRFAGYRPQPLPAKR
jgi:hypothetical protein